MGSQPLPRVALVVLGVLGFAACGGAAPAAPARTAAAATGERPSPPPVATTSASVASETASASEPAPPSSPGAWPFEAEPQTEDGRRALLDRLAKDPGPQKTNWTPPGRSERYGHAEGAVAAPLPEVKKRLLDFNHYKELAGPKFKTVRVVGKEEGGTDVYFQLPIMKGLVTIWYVTRFAAPRTVGGGEVLEGTFVKGNIKGMHIVLRVAPGADPKSSVMMCDLLLSPGLPAPQSALDEELRDACGDAITNVRRLTGT